MLYVYILSSYNEADTKKIKEFYQGKDLYSGKQPEYKGYTRWSKTMDFHGLKGQSDGSYKYQDGTSPKNKPNIKDFSPTQDNQELFPEKRLLGKYCCCGGS
jgi:hypothetical protein